MTLVHLLDELIDRLWRALVWWALPDGALQTHSWRTKNSQEAPGGHPA